MTITLDKHTRTRFAQSTLGVKIEERWNKLIDATDTFGLMQIDKPAAELLEQRFALRLVRLIEAGSALDLAEALIWLVEFETEYALEMLNTPERRPEKDDGNADTPGLYWAERAEEAEGSYVLDRTMVKDIIDAWRSFELDEEVEA